MRAFIAIFPPKDLIKEFKDTQNKLIQYKNFLRFADPSTIHITLRYLGDRVRGDELTRLINELKKRLYDFKSFNIRLNKVQFGFNEEKWPRILFISLFRNDKLDRLVSLINHTVDDLDLASVEGIKIENNIYHFTLCRKRKDLSRNMVNKISSLINDISLEDGFVVKKIDFISSVLSARGPIYSSIDHIRFTE